MTTRMIDFDIFFQCTQLFHFLEQNYRQTTFLAKGGAGKGAFAPTGRPAVKQPLEATVKNRLERELGEDLPNVIVHRGDYSNTVLRVFAAWALTEGNNIYIKDEAYKEGSTETEKILVHEAKHVLQLKNNMKIQSAGDREIAEAEAEQAEQEIVGDIWEEPTILYESPNGRTRFKMSDKKKPEIKYKILERVLERIEERKFVHDAEEHIQYLLRLQKFANEPCLKTGKTPWEVLLHELEVELKERLRGGIGGI